MALEDALLQRDALSLLMTRLRRHVVQQVPVQKEEGGRCYERRKLTRGGLPLVIHTICAASLLPRSLVPSSLSVSPVPPYLRISPSFLLPLPYPLSIALSQPRPIFRCLGR